MNLLTVLQHQAGNIAAIGMAQHLADFAFDPAHTEIFTELA